MTPTKTALRWMWIWITIGALVVLVVIGFLFSIANALESIDSGLNEAATAVTGARGDVKPLPAHIQDVNATLDRVDTNLRSLPQQADEVIGELDSIQSTLGDVEGSLNSTSSSLVETSNLLVATEGSLNDTATLLVDAADTLGSIATTLARTEGSLSDTSRSLIDTEGELNSAEATLNETLALAARIERRLELAQNFESLGTNGIFKRVDFLNGFDGEGPGPGDFRRDDRNENGLRFIENDADGIRQGLQEVNKHLNSICESEVLRVFAARSEGQC